MTREQDDLEEALGAVAKGTDAVERLRSDPLIYGVLKTFRKKPKYKIDALALQDEIKALDDSCEFGSFAVEGTGGLVEAAEQRANLRAVRSRLVAMSRSLRDVHFYASRVYRVCAVRLRESEDLQGVTPVKRVDELISIILREVHDVVDEVKLLLDLIKEALLNVDEKTKGVDAWFSLHKQYVFLTYKGPPDGGENHEENEGRSRRRLGRPRG